MKTRISQTNLQVKQKFQELANVLGGVIGASRVAVDNGWISPAHQVGQNSC